MWSSGSSGSGAVAVGRASKRVPSMAPLIPASALPEVTPTWEAAGVSEALLLGLGALGYEAPSKVQARVLPAVERETLTPVGVQRARDNRSDPICHVWHPEPRPRLIVA